MLTDYSLNVRFQNKTDIKNSKKQRLFYKRINVTSKWLNY